ncbi:oxaloacetate decarboxylase [Paraburkholderia fungorum]|uniref:Carboxyvinyl-carboxyphosphonate phosphorylmutase n=1 Tax=Paraburkholderia fungorum TaxID=134537 RepID=A0A420FK83_9BURK|nr:isocitrate lyase/PEP mutase family protein [Paraburkholderia fungorum]RKF33360.1 carboxyvinyl-carboxyphosphonate phosphorylmutase [Paraburkholderia fungorum]
MKATKRLRELLAGDEIVVLPGAYDGLTARLVEQAGFPGVYMTGAGTAASYGYPDYGLITMTEMTEKAAVLARSVKIPVIADADTGYGNELNVTRAVREFEARGIAGIHIEDQVSPKRCGHLDGKEIVPLDVFVANIRAAVQAKSDPDFLIIARSDARAVAGLDEAIDRVNAALTAGADMAFVEAPCTMDEVATIPQRVAGPCLLNMVPAGRTPLVTTQEAQEMGFRMVLYPGIMLVAQITAGAEALRTLRDTKKAPTVPLTAQVMQAFQVLGAAEWDELRSGFQSVAQASSARRGT